MWDLNVLQQLNEQAYLSSLKLVNDGIGGESATPATPAAERVFPLAILAAKLITGPPSLARLIDLFQDYDSVIEFIELVREFLPQHEGEIMTEVDDLNRIMRFCHYFSNQYFPLSDSAAYEDYTLADFTRLMPVDLMGFSYDDYEGFNDYRDGFVLLLSMVESPYEDEERVPILERVKELVGKSLVELIPPEGWSLNDIHRMLDETEYEGCAVFADWIHSNTGCWQLDATYNDYEPEVWSRDVVDGLTRQWQTVIDLQDKMTHMYKWLEEDIHHNFAKLLEVMLGVKYEPVAKEQMSFPLDDDGQVIRKEVIENG